MNDERRHVNSTYRLSFIVKSLFVPFKRAFAQYVVKTNQENAYKHQDCIKSRKTHFPEVDGVGVKENHLHIEQYEQNGCHQIFNGHGVAGVALRCDTAFEVFVFFHTFPAGAQPWYDDENKGYEAERDERLQYDRKIP